MIFSELPICLFFPLANSVYTYFIALLIDRYKLRSSTKEINTWSDMGDTELMISSIAETEYSSMGLLILYLLAYATLSCVK